MNADSRLQKFGLVAFQRSASFLRRQQKDWKVTVIRTSLERFSYQLVFPYLSIYIVALGATATQLGIVNSLGMILGGLCGPFTGWLIDRIGPKKIYLFGISLLAVSYLTYSLAQNWGITAIAMVFYWLGFSTSIHSCSTICGNCLINSERATGMMICETAAAGVLGMAGPILATWIVSQLGGVSVAALRPLFFAGVIISIGTFLIVLTQLSTQRWTAPDANNTGFIKDISNVFSSNKYLKRWLVIGAVTQLPVGMVFPFSQVFAYQIKGADAFVLGAMITGSALASVVFAIPMGRLADKIGRKKVLFITIPLFWVANVLLVLAPSPAFLIIAGALQGFHYIGSPIAAAVERELVPAEQMGKWTGITRLCRMIFSAIVAFTAGVVWDKLGPQYIFFLFIGIDLLFRIPLLISLPETLHLKPGLKAFSTE